MFCGLEVKSEQTSPESCFRVDRPDASTASVTCRRSSAELSSVVSSSEAPSVLIVSDRRRRRSEHQTDHGGREQTHRRVRLRIRQKQPKNQRDGRPQSQHHVSTTSLVMMCSTHFLTAIQLTNHRAPALSLTVCACVCVCVQADVRRSVSEKVS